MTPVLLWKALRQLWMVGLLRMTPLTALRVFKAWRRCPASVSFLADTAGLRFPEAIALVDDSGPVSFSQLQKDFHALAARIMLDEGIGAGHRIAVMERNHRTFIVALLAAARTGADVLLVNPASPPEVVDRLLSVHGVDLVLHGTDIAFGPFPAGLKRVSLCSGRISAARERPLPPVRRAGALQILTSGTTATARKVGRRPTLKSLLPAVSGLLKSLPIRMHQPTVLAIPLYHGYGLSTLAMALATASPLHLGRSVEVASLLRRDVFSSRPIVVSIPTLLKRWIAPAGLVDNVAAVITGSAPLDASLSLRLAERLGAVVHNLYGSTEAGIVAVASPQMLADAPDTVGRPLPGTEIRVADGQNLSMPPGAIGRILVRGPLVLTPDATGWLDTGDLGQIDDEGRLFVCGRSDEMFISGGENVYPQEVEALLSGHPYIEEVAIAVLPDPEFGRVMHACIVVSSEQKMSCDEIRGWLKQRAERHKIPKAIEIVEELPRNPLGKIDRQLLLKNVCFSGQLFSTAGGQLNAVAEIP